MRRFSRLRPSPAMVVACLALFIAFGGIAYAVSFPRNSIGARQIKTNAVGASEIRRNAVSESEIRNRAVRSGEVADSTLTGSDIVESSLGKVPSAANADSANTANTANNANNLGGQPPTAYASSSSEAYHEVGAVGEPAFGNGWTNFGGTFSTAAFYKDSLEVVHLKGMLAGIADPSLAGTAFTLPEGYRPAKDLVVGVASTGANKYMYIRASGAVQPQESPGNDIGIDGLSFRAGG